MRDSYTDNLTINNKYKTHISRTVENAEFPPTSKINPWVFMTFQ